jgi:hypothetical protein
MSDDLAVNSPASKDDAASAFKRMMKDSVEFPVFPYLQASVPLTTLSGVILQLLFVALLSRQLFGGTNTFQSAPLDAQTFWILLLLIAGIYTFVYQCYRIPHWRAALERLAPGS